MSIDWASVHWGYVALLSAFTFIAALIANVVTFRHRLAGAIAGKALLEDGVSRNPALTSRQLLLRESRRSTGVT